MRKTPADPIPSSLAPFFQEYDFARLDPERHADLIIERALAYGDRQELRWLYARYGKPRLIEWFIRLGRRRLPRRRFNLWRVLLDLPQVEPPRRTLWPH